MKDTDYNSTMTVRLASAAASDNPTVAVDRGCRLMAIRGDNVKAAKVYLKIYDKATAPASTDTPRATFVIAASGPFSFNLAAPLSVVKGLSYRLTGGAADNDATALVAGDIVQMNLDVDG
jgi:hypothetical protein